MVFQPLQQSRRTPRTGVGLMVGSMIAVGLACTASPTMARTEYLGGGFITVDDVCAQYGWTGTHQVMLRMEPQGLPDNAENETQMAILMNTGTIALRLNLDHGIRYSYTPTQAVYIWNGPYAPASPTMTLSFGIDADWPLRGDYMIERLQVRIYNFNEHPGCSAWLYGSLVQN
ncbi:hypothetical protein [Pararhodobacter sp.]|uniref:hypothetical protein n=1 Tax=Pararhodobacter sp. TaxID=2127056 RepID=UPI002AFE4B96|nr:hypothetical protein [Pararhodobacter sp.]